MAHGPWAFIHRARLRPASLGRSGPGARWPCCVVRAAVHVLRTRICSDQCACADSFRLSSFDYSNSIMTFRVFVRNFCPAAARRRRMGHTGPHPMIGMAPGPRHSVDSLTLSAHSPQTTTTPHNKTHNTRLPWRVPSISPAQHPTAHVCHARGHCRARALTPAASTA